MKTTKIFFRVSRNSFQTNQHKFRTEDWSRALGSLMKEIFPTRKYTIHLIFYNVLSRTKYSRMDHVKFVEHSLLKNFT